MKGIKHTYIASTMVLTATLCTSCVKDDLYGTPHPDCGAVVVTADWSGRSSEASIPQQHILRIGGLEQEVSGEANVFGQLLPPGQYTLAVYNRPGQITVTDNTATVNSTSATHISPTPGYLFAAVQDISVPADDTLRVTAQMRQMVRRLDLELTATEGDHSRVQSASATLSGVASAADMATGERSAAAQVTSAFGQDGNKFTALFRLLGIVPAEAQTLTVDITFSNGDTQRIASDLTKAMRGFNDSTTPVTLTGNLLLPVEAGTTGATITDWNEAECGNGHAD